MAYNGPVTPEAFFARTNFSGEVSFEDANIITSIISRALETSAGSKLIGFAVPDVPITIHTGPGPNGETGSANQPRKDAAGNITGYDIYYDFSQTSYQVMDTSGNMTLVQKADLILHEFGHLSGLGDAVSHTNPFRKRTVQESLALSEVSAEILVPLDAFGRRESQSDNVIYVNQIERELRALYPDDPEFGALYTRGDYVPLAQGIDIFLPVIKYSYFEFAGNYDDAVLQYDRAIITNISGDPIVDGLMTISFAGGGMLQFGGLPGVANDASGLTNQSAAVYNAVGELFKGVGSTYQQSYRQALFSGTSTAEDTGMFRDSLAGFADNLRQLAVNMPTGGATFAENLAFVNGALDWWTGTAGGQAIYIDLLIMGPNGPYSDGDNIAAVERGFGSLIASIGGLVSNYGGSVGQTAVGYNDLVALEAVLLSAGVQAQNIAFFYNAVTTGVGTIAPGAATDKFGGVFSATITAMQAMLQALANTPGGGATMLSPILSEAAMLASLIKSDITNLTMLTYGTGPEVQALVADINGIVFSDFDNTPLLLQEFSAVLGNFKGLAGGGSGIASIEGTTGDDVLAGLASADTINGNNGNDTITGAGGADVLNGGNGDDVFIVNAGDVMTGATIDGGAGDDTILMTGGGDLSAAAVSNVETLQVGGAVTLTAAQLAGFVGLTGGGTLTAAAAGTFDLGIKAGANIINLTGSAGDDVLSGDGNAQILDGGDGNDTLMGGGGADTLLGGNGDDVFIVTTGDVVTGATIDGGAGANILAAANDNIGQVIASGVVHAA